MSPARTSAARVALALAVLVQLAVLYAPADTGPLPFPNADKVVHVLVFLVPAALGVLVTRRPWPVAGVLVGHAVVSEVVQASLLPLRSGDLRDALADTVGVALGVLLGLRLLRRWSGEGSARW